MELIICRKDEVGPVSEGMAAPGSRVDQLSAHLLINDQSVFQAVVEQCPDVVTMLSEDGAIVFQNPASQPVLGYAPLDLLGKSFLDFVHPDDKEHFNRAVSRAFACGTGRSAPYRLATAAGDWKWIESAVMARPGEPPLCGVLLSSRDIASDTLPARRLYSSSADRSTVQLAERLMQILELDSQSAALVDEGGRIQQINTAGKVLFSGDASQELTGLSLHDLIPAEHKAEFTDLLDKALAGATRDLEHEIEMPGGARIWIKSRAFAIPSGNGETRSLLLLSTGVSEQRLMTGLLQASNARFERIFDLSPRAMSIERLEDGSFVKVNDSFVAVGGFGREEMIGKTAVELGLWCDPSDRQEALRLLREQGSFPSADFKLKVKGGEERVIRMSALLVEVDGEQCVLTTCEDITRRKRFEEEQMQLQAALQKSALEWRLTFDAVESPILLLDLPGRVVRLNRAARDLSGRSYWEAKGRPVEEVSPNQPWQKCGELAQLMRQSRAGCSAQARDSQTEKTWDINGNVFSGTGIEDRILIIARDVTSTVQLQESLRRSETMSAMGALVAGVAHEVRNPLFSISATLDAFEARFGEKEEHQRYTAVLRSELERLNLLMQELLEYGRPATLELVRGSVTDAINQALLACFSLADKLQVTLVNRVQSGLPQIMMDRRRLVQVFQNLVDNAIQHSARGQTVEITAAATPAAGSTWIECSVSDSGPGFSEEDIPRLFEPFFTKRRGGTGLGLSIVQRIVEEHGGRIRARNRAQGGAAMEVRFKALD